MSLMRQKSGEARDGVTVACMRALVHTVAPSPAARLEDALAISPSLPHLPCSEQDRYLPVANIGRIMKKALPGNAKVAKDAKEQMQVCVSEFISFITSE